MGTFMDALEDLVKSTEFKANEKFNNVKNELEKIDLTSDEGYSKYMNFLGDLRIKAGKHNDFFKFILGEDVNTLLDRIAQEATDKYLAAREEREAEKARKANEEYIKETSKKQEQKKFDINNDHKQESREDLEYSFMRIVDKYINDTHIIYYKDELRDAIRSELLDFTRWLHNTDLN